MGHLLEALLPGKGESKGTAYRFPFVLASRSNILGQAPRESVAQALTFVNGQRHAGESLPPDKDAVAEDEISLYVLIWSMNIPAP